MFCTVQEAVAEVINRLIIEDCLLSAPSPVNRGKDGMGGMKTTSRQLITNLAQAESKKHARGKGGRNGFTRSGNERLKSAVGLNEEPQDLAIKKLEGFPGAVARVIKP